MEKYKQEVYDSYVDNKQALIGKKSKNLFEVCDLIRIRNIANKYFPKDKRMPILDLGCGHGKLIGILKELGYTNCKGIDISEQQIELASKHGITSASKNDIQEFLTSTTEQFDVIFLMNILEHFTKEVAFRVLDLIFSSLKDGGVLILRVPNGEGIFGGRAFYGDFTHEVCYTSQSLNQVFKTIGLSEIDFVEEYPVIHGVKSFLRWCVWKTFRSFIKFILYAETGPENYILSQNIIAVVRKIR